MEHNKVYKLGIRREEFNKWERRVVLTPKNCRRLLFEMGDKLIIKVQPSESRIFKDNQFRAVGCVIDEDITDCDVILGVKQVPRKSLYPDKTYMFFSHVIKAQKDNMEMLDHILANNIRLIDYERIADSKGRLVAFGTFAGNAGVIDIFSGLGAFLLNRGIGTPFINISQSYMYLNIDTAKNSIRTSSIRIETEGLSHHLTPFIVGVTGNGRAATGAREILELMPHEYITPEELPILMEAATKDPASYNQCIYIVNFMHEHLVQKIDDDGKPFDKQDYYANPFKYKGTFQKTYLPYLSVLMNCMYWDDKFPRLITGEHLQKYIKEGNSLRLLAISDVTCDYMGSIDFLKKFTTIDKPFFVYHPESMDTNDDYQDAKKGILYDSIENMPTQFPLDASSHFGSQLVKFIIPILKSDFNADIDNQNLPDPIKRAVITHKGKHTPLYTYISKLRQSKEVGIEAPTHNIQQFRKAVAGQTSYIVKFTGHLFDTNAINEILDYLIDQEKIFASIVNWNVGFGTDKPTSCTIKLVPTDRKDIIEAKLKEICEKKDISMMVGSIQQETD